MAFNNRWICKYDNSFSFDEIKENIKTNDFFIENTNFNSLKHKIDIYEEFNSEKLNFFMENMDMNMRPMHRLHRLQKKESSILEI